MPKIKPRTFEKTSGRLFPNGAIELVNDKGHDSLKLLLWTGSKALIQARVNLTKTRTFGSDSEVQPVTFDPVSTDASVRQAVRFPSHADSFGTSRQLLNDICEVIKRYTNLTDNSVLLAAHAVRASWFPEAPDFPVGLAICGPRSPQRRQLFRLLSCIYRRALILGEMSPAAVCSLPMVLSPSLFIEDYRYSPPLEKLIRTAFSRGHVPFKGKLLRTTCATVISIDEPLMGTFPGQNIVEIPTERSRATLPILRPQDEQEIADRFQPKLLMYRLQNYKEVLNSAFDAPSLTYPVSELARGLAACVVDDPKRQADIVNLLSSQNEHAEQDLSLDPRVTVLKAVLYLCHKGKKQSIHVGDVTAAANSILEDSGELPQMTSRMVGSKLHLLGLATARLDSAGRGLQLNNEMRRRIHQVAWNYRVQFPTPNGNPCDQCLEIVAQGEGKEPA